MKFKVQVQSTKTTNHIPGYWTDEDYQEILKTLEHDEAAQSTGSELMEYLTLALTDLEPQEAAEIVLQHKLQDRLNKNQINQISHDMPKENQAVHYSGIPLQHDLFHINTLLYRVFNGVFPRAEATVTTVYLAPRQNADVSIDEALVLRALADGISDRATIKRIFQDQMAGREEFDEAPDLIWYFDKTGEHTYQITTSDYWLDRSDFVEMDFIADIKL